MSGIVYNKVDETSAEVIALADSLKVTRKEVATLINQDRYRRAYNRLRNAEMSALRKLVKDNPQLMKEVKA